MRGHRRLYARVLGLPENTMVLGVGDDEWSRPRTAGASGAASKRHSSRAGRQQQRLIYKTIRTSAYFYCLVASYFGSCRNMYVASMWTGKVF